ncbi:MAG: DUF4914 domain-containing protein [Bacteroidetes bacterium HGW-Bacteroidetes-1]|nr:MAG: DUF4914 domain-containing protein [Bacteroidetes bacterium HGW-Bacteroidetes-1]
MMNKKINFPFNIPSETLRIIEGCKKSVTLFETYEALAEASLGGSDNLEFEVKYEVPGKGEITEAIVHKVTNGISANYIEPYMRRRDPDTMLIADDKPTDKERFIDRIGHPFSGLRSETFDWLKSQDLGFFFFKIGLYDKSPFGMAIAPANAAFFSMGLAMLQKIVAINDIPEGTDIYAVIYVAPPFRHTHFDGKQIVVHNRLDSIYEIFSYNLYPGPSAKKGIYGVLLTIGEEEGWVTTHCSAVESVSPYDNITRFMHEGASGGGKSEMLQHIVRESSGEVLVGVNSVTGEKRTIQIPRFCEIRPVCDDMATVHPSVQTESRRMRLVDAENSWFIRTDNITGYGIDPVLEKITINASKPLLFLNIKTHPGGTALIWNHIEDAPGKPCPNPRVVVPRELFEAIDTAVHIDVRSFGVRTPPCSELEPTYGIFGLFHILPPALAWLWRLVSPRGHANPSIISTGMGMESEGVGSYWPFATGKKVRHANLLLEQIAEKTDTRYVLTPNQFVGVWKVGFRAQLLMREYLTRRGNSKFRPDQVSQARCPLLGYEMEFLTIEGSKIPSRFLKTYKQPEVGFAGYDKGAEIITSFFKKELEQYRTKELSDLGHRIIETCLNNGTAEDYEKLIPRK